MKVAQWALALGICVGLTSAAVAHTHPRHNHTHHYSNADKLKAAKDLLKAFLKEAPTYKNGSYKAIVYCVGGYPGQKVTIDSLTYKDVFEPPKNCLVQLSAVIESGHKQTLGPYADKKKCQAVCSRDMCRERADHGNACARLCPPPMGSKSCKELE